MGNTIEFSYQLNDRKSDCNIHVLNEVHESVIVDMYGNKSVYAVGTCVNCGAELIGATPIRTDKPE